jgi:hypothetical protein
MVEALHEIIDAVSRVPIPLGWALVIGLFLYGTYLYSQLRKDMKVLVPTLGQFWEWTCSQGSGKAFFGLVIFGVLFILVYVVAEIQLPFIGVAAISWGPWSALSAFLRITNGKTK